MKANERHKNCKKGLHFLCTAYLAVKSYFFTYDEKDTGQFICWFTDNSDHDETNAKDNFTEVSCNGINHYS